MLPAGQPRRASSTDQTGAGWTAADGGPDRQGKGPLRTRAGGHAEVPHRKHPDDEGPSKDNTEQQGEGQ